MKYETAEVTALASAINAIWGKTRRGGNSALETLFLQ